MAAYIYSRDIASDVQSAPETFTSWDKCMQKAYCKWPAIVGIIVGSLILLSCIWCVASCLCCGARLCSCCCGGCDSCCSSGRNRDRPSKFKDDDYSRMPPAPYQGFQPAPAPMAYGNPYTPQFATFDDPSRKINEDSLPPMPSWDTAIKRRVEDTSEPPVHAADGDLELARLNTQPQTMRGGYNSVPNGPISPVSANPYAHSDYFQDHNQSHPYNPDLGVQRMGPTGNDYGNFEAVPISPPPTYRSSPRAPSSTSDQFMVGAASPSPDEWNRLQAQPYQHQPPSSYATSNMSTQYEMPQQDHAANRISMPTPYNSQPYALQPQQQYQQPRPPSFLQPGRKPVSRSYREV